MPSHRPRHPAARIGKILTALLLLALLAAGGLQYHRWTIDREEQALLKLTLHQPRNASIPRGATLAQIADTVVGSDFPVTRRQFIRLAKRLRIDKTLQAGHYQFAAGRSIEQVLRALAEGKIISQKITLIEGITLADLRRQLQTDPRLTHRLQTLTDDDLRRQLDIDTPHLEGWFLPETYFFNPGDSDLSILKRAHHRMKDTLKEAWHTRQQRDTLKTPYEALILASIVEKETGKGEERPLIASVFLNRLRVGIRLQADPTVIYGIGATFDGNITRAHLRQDTPYNTYTRGGLPPTPIALPGKAAIQAVLNPAASPYYYFVATGDGGHHFSETLREHNNAVNRYQRRRR